MTTPDPIITARDKLIAKVRTILPGLWAAAVGSILTWVVTHGWIDKDVAYQWQGYIVAGTTTVVVTVSLWPIYGFARWIEAKRGPVARFIAKVLLGILSPPKYVAPSPAAVLPPEVETDPTAGPAPGGLADVERPKGITKPPA